ncbi:MAG: TetR/AcrR family transcriptional regulator, partial [Nocardioidaceae bacterium]
SEDVLQERMNSILDTTLELVARMGADHVRLRDVADAASVSVGTLQHYFYTRDQLLQAAFARHTREVVGNIERYADTVALPSERVLSLMDGVTRDAAFPRRSALWIEFAAAAIRSPDLRELMGEAYGSWRRMLMQAVDEGIETGQFRPVLAPDVVVSTLLALIDGNELALSIGVAGTTSETIADQLDQVSRTLLGIA